jgi:hypothetical protein
MVSREPIRKFLQTLKQITENEPSVRHERRSASRAISYGGISFEYRIAVRYGFPSLEIAFCSGEIHSLRQVGTCYVLGDGNGVEHLSGSEVADHFVRVLRDRWNERLAS